MSPIPAPWAPTCAWASPSAATPPTRPSTPSSPPLLGGLGARGYRAAQLEAGIVAGRLALNAFALGGGATGLTFYDGLVSRYFRSEAAPLSGHRRRRARHAPRSKRRPGAAGLVAALRERHEQAGLPA